MGNYQGVSNAPAELHADGTQSLFHSQSFQLWTPVFPTEGPKLFLVQ